MVFGAQAFASTCLPVVDVGVDECHIDWLETSVNDCQLGDVDLTVHGVLPEASQAAETIIAIAIAQLIECFICRAVGAVLLACYHWVNRILAGS